MLTTDVHYVGNFTAGLTEENGGRSIENTIGMDELFIVPQGLPHYMSNHVAVAYGDIFEEMVAVGQGLGLKVRVLSSSP